MNLLVHTSSSAAVLPAGDGYEPEDTAHPPALARGERQVAQEVLAQVTLHCEQAAASLDGEHRNDRGFWSFLLDVAA